MAMTELTVAETLEQGRRKASITQERLVELFRERTRTKTSYATIRNWLKGRTEPRASEYRALISILNEQLPDDQQISFEPSPSAGRGCDLQMAPAMAA